MLFLQCVWNLCHTLRACAYSQSLCQTGSPCFTVVCRISRCVRSFCSLGSTSSASSSTCHRPRHLKTCPASQQTSPCTPAHTALLFLKERRRCPPLPSLLKSRLCPCQRCLRLSRKCTNRSGRKGCKSCDLRKCLSLSLLWL